MKRLLLLFVVLVLLVVLAACAEEVEALFFYKNACPKCVRIDALLHQMQETHTGVTIDRREIHTEGNIDLLQRLEDLYQMRAEDVPVVFIDDEYFQGAGRAVEYSIKQGPSASR